MKTSKTKLGIIGTVGVPARYGGFETLAQQLVLQIRDEFDITVYCSSKSYAAGERIGEWEKAKLVYIPLKANGIQSIPYDMLSMLHAVFFSQVLLVLGVSGCIFLPLIKFFFPWKQIVVNIDGLEWRRPKWSSLAKRFLLFSEKVAVRFADEIITDNAAIQKYVHDKYGAHSRLIEYGADHVSAEKIRSGEIGSYPFLEDDYAFKVCRIEPENNIHTVLEAFARFGQLPLVLVGNWEHSEYGRELRQLYRSYNHLYLLDPIYDPAVLNMLRSNCTLYVHGHSAGGTNPSLVEAMYLGLPVLAYGVIYNRITTKGYSLYFDSVEDILNTLKEISQAELLQVAYNLKWVANNHYTWGNIAYKYSQALQGIQKEPLPVFDFELPSALVQA